MVTPIDDADNTTASTTARCFLEPDPLAEALCEGAGTSTNRTWTTGRNADEHEALLHNGEAGKSPKARNLIRIVFFLEKYNKG